MLSAAQAFPETAVEEGCGQGGGEEVGGSGASVEVARVGTRGRRPEEGTEVVGQDGSAREKGKGERRPPEPFGERGDHGEGHDVVAGAGDPLLHEDRREDPPPAGLGRVVVQGGHGCGPGEPDSHSGQG